MRARRRSRGLHAMAGAPSPDLLCVAVNKAQPQYLALASADRYVRVYDRRKLPSATAHPSDDGAVAPGGGFTGYNKPQPALLFTPLALMDGQDPDANQALGRVVM